MLMLNIKPVCVFQLFVRLRPQCFSIIKLLVKKKNPQSLARQLRVTSAEDGVRVVEHKRHTGIIQSPDRQGKAVQYLTLR